MKEPRFDYDLSYGQEGERIAQAWHAGKHETKRKTRNDLKFYVELEHNPFHTGWKPSGLSVTEADYFEWVIADTEIVVAVPTTVLRSAINWWVGEPKQERDGDCPTKGVLVDLSKLLGFAVSGKA